MQVEIRFDKDQKKSVNISGYVNVAGRDSRPIMDRGGAFIEQIVPGAFGDALRSGHPVGLMFNHSKDLGGTEAGNLSLREDNIGLYASATVSDEEVIAAAEKKELRGWSFGFVAEKDCYKEDEGGKRRRYVQKMDLREVSILNVTPAYIATSIETRGEKASLIECGEIINDNIRYTETKESKAPEEEKVGKFLAEKLGEIKKYKED